MKLSFPKLHVEAGGGSGCVVHAVLRRVHTGDIVFDKHVLHYKHTHTPWEAVVLYQPCPCQHQHAANSLWGLRSTCTPRVPLQRPDGCHPSTPAHIALLPLCLFDWTSCRRQSGALFTLPTSFFSHSIPVLHLLLLFSPLGCVCERQTPAFPLWTLIGASLNVHVLHSVGACLSTRQFRTPQDKKHGSINYSALIFSTKTVFAVENWGRWRRCSLCDCCLNGTALDPSVTHVEFTVKTNLIQLCNSGQCSP